jgi:hypothetical protein
MIAIHKYTFSDAAGVGHKECVVNLVYKDETVKELCERIGLGKNKHWTNERIEIRYNEKQRDTR